MSIFQLEREGDMAALADALDGADSPAVREQAAEALGNLDPPETGATGPYETMLQSLRGAIVDDPDERVRAAAVSALEDHGIDQVRRLVADITDQPTEKIDQRHYARLVNADRPEIRMVGLAALGLEGTPAHAEVVIGAFDDPDPRVRERAVRATAELGLSRAEPRLVTALTDDVPAVRTAAANAIGDLSLRSSSDALAAATEDDHESVRLAAIDALASIGSPAAIEPLASALGSSTPSINRLAVYGLLELLSNAPASASHTIRQRVQRVVAEVPRTSVVDTLVDLVSDLDGSAQRRNAIWLLGRLVGPNVSESAIRCLVDHVGDDDDHTAKLATSALVGCEGAVVERTARERLNVVDPDDPAAGQLAYVLGRVGSTRSISALEDVLEQTETQSVRKQVVGALNRLDRPGRTNR